MLIKAQLRWVGHVIRTEEHCLPRRLLYAELLHGKRNKAVQSSDTKTLWMQISRGRSLNLKILRSSPMIDQLGESKYIMVLSPSRILTVRSSPLPGHRQQWLRQRTFSDQHCSRICTSSLGFTDKMQKRYINVGFQEQMIFIFLFLTKLFWFLVVVFFWGEGVAFWNY